MKIGDFAHFFIKTFVVVTNNINVFEELTKMSFKCHEILPSLVFLQLLQEELHQALVKKRDLRDKRAAKTDGNIVRQQSMAGDCRCVHIMKTCPCIIQTFFSCKYMYSY